MRHTKTTLPGDRLDTTIRVLALAEPEIRAYISSLKQQYSKYRLSLEAGRKVIDSVVKDASLTDVLYEAREQ